MRQLPLDDVRRTILTGVVEHKTIQQLFDAVYEIIQLPMICFDPSFSLVAYAFERPFYYPHWEWMAQKGAAAESTVLEYDYFKNQERMIEERDPVLFNEGTTYGFDQYCGAVLNGDQLLAYCGIITEDVAREEVLEATRLLIRAVSIIWGKGSRLESLDYSLIVDRRLSPQQVAYLTRRYEGSYLFAVLTCEVHQSSTLQYVKVYLLRKGHRLISYLIGQNMLYILACGQAPDGKDSTFLEDCAILAEKHRLMIGISDLFDDAAEIPLHREQALLSLSTGFAANRQLRVCRFNDLYCDLLCQTALEYYGPELCEPREIQLLEREDREKGTDYLHTLKVWLQQGRSSSAAAEILGQHKATVANRLERIGELIGMAPKDCFLRLELELEFFRMLTRKNTVNRKDHTHERL